MPKEAKTHGERQALKSREARWPVEGEGKPRKVLTDWEDRIRMIKALRTAHYIYQVGTIVPAEKLHIAKKYMEMFIKLPFSVHQDTDFIIYVTNWFCPVF